MAKEIIVNVDVNTKDAVKGVDSLDKSMSSLSDTTEKQAQSTDKLSESLEESGGAFGSAVGGAKALGKQFLALMANPIVLVISGIAVVLGTLFKAFSRTEAGGGKLNKGMNLLSGVFSSFMNVIEPVATFIVDVLVGAFESFGEAADKALGEVAAGLAFLGFDSAADSVRNFTAATGELVKKTNELSDLENNLLKTRREQRLIEKQALIDAEKLRQQRDDESNSLQERIEFNKQLGAVLQKQSKDELAIAGDALRAAQLKLEIDGETTEALDGLADAKLEILDINERINGQQSEQLANENSLRNEGIANAKERQAIKQTEADAQDALDSAAAVPSHSP